MKVADLSRRVNDVSDSMKTLRIDGTTRIDWNCLISAERVLFEKVRKIQGDYLPHIPPRIRSTYIPQI